MIAEGDPRGLPEISRTSARDALQEAGIEIVSELIVSRFLQASDELVGARGQQFFVEARAILGQFATMLSAYGDKREHNELVTNMLLAALTNAHVNLSARLIRESRTNPNPGRPANQKSR